MAKISIIVPVYKVEKYIDRCIKSILDQTFTDFELILVDDGSPDKCGIICDNYSKNDERIKVIHKKNEGLAAARNTGIDVATGEYLAFVDSDDFINKNMYKVLYNNANKYDADISICNLKYIYPNEFINENEILFDKEIDIYNNIKALEKLYSDEKIQFIVAWNKIYKRELFFNIRYDYGKYHEDEFIIHKLLYKCNKVVYCSDKLYYYLQRDGSIMKSNFNVKKLDIIDAMKERMDFFRQKGFLDLEYKTQNNYLYYFFQYYYRTKYELKDIKILKNMKIKFRKILKYLFKNPNYNIKAKILWSIFVINSSLYFLIVKSKYINKVNSSEL